MNLSSSSPKLRVTHWDSIKALDGVERSNIFLPKSEKIRRKDFLWNAMLTEYDAANLDKYLKTQFNAFSDEFLAFENAWRLDEWNHYLGFRRIYSVLYDEPEEEIVERLERNTGDFDPIAEFLDDEFKVILVLAYDEIATFKSYLAEFSFYKTLDNAKIFRWFQKVTNDELNHFQNCMEIIRSKYSTRGLEISHIIDRFIKWDLSRHPYTRTFVFDHYWYSQEFLEHCRRLIDSYVPRGLKGVNFTTRIETNDTADIFERYRYL